MSAVDFQSSIGSVLSRLSCSPDGEVALGVLYALKELDRLRSSDGWIDSVVDTLTHRRYVGRWTGDVRKQMDLPSPSFVWDSGNGRYRVRLEWRGGRRYWYALVDGRRVYVGPFAGGFPSDDRLHEVVFG